VCYNNEIPVQISSNYDAIVLSPGPGLPEGSGSLSVLVKEHLGKIPILGVCLGMQALVIELGGALFNQEVVKHGVQESIWVTKGVLFSSDDESYEVGLYHSWAVTNDGDYHVTASTEKGIAMAIENKELKCFGVQFHPESIMTPGGMGVLRNFLVEVEEGPAVNEE
jgi:anthranilate synthase component 2